MLPPSFDARHTDHVACRHLIRHGSRSFFFASLLLPQPMREPAYALYAFCRLADDAVDDAPQSQAEAVARLRARLDAVYAGAPHDIAADRAFAEIVSRFALPYALPDALLEGFEWDAAERRYDDLPDLHAYAARVAGTVGVMMSLLMGVRRPEALARAADLGVAMQLTNIARDVGEDARMGRLYLPRAWLVEAGIEPEAWLAAPRFDARLRDVIERLLSEADHLYARALAGIAILPRGCRPGIHAARLIYGEIGHSLRRCGHDSVNRRAVVTRGRKLHLLARAHRLAWLERARIEPAPALSATQFLLDAVARAPQPEAQPERSYGERVVWALELLARMDEREELARARPTVR